MPPSNVRAVLSSSIRCHACANASITRRAFASSPASRSVGPESPKYIEVPQPPQQTAPYTPVVKGALPVPRNIFVTRSEWKKESEEFINAATPEPSETIQPTGPHAERLAWKQRLSALRRRNLREGVTSLYKRKQRTDQYLAKRGAQRQDEQIRLINQPPRDDEVFTNPSVSKAVREFLDGSYNKAPRKDVAAQRAALQARENAKSRERKDALHTLYVHARDFIVTEDQLSKVIEDTFGTDDNLPGFQPGNPKQGRSIWARDAPLSTADMLARQQGRSNMAGERHQGSEPVTRRRIQKIAEELTGGKL
ncbi:hypothetical protein MPH_07410 [Macrophomina phaseolina MS6]|uniref:Uncharacterized protein n=2 Tax=Macrophomina phaseolina TaxID=35725 RepID=K2RYT1_MACPH|nr:hypothetical protein MPH_07410 [Macrophomina phaseolina MS6]KAH7048318.1 hypothetical protein B0J12DRAFT_665670 [Macrophomina phaseolina]